MQHTEMSRDKFLTRRELAETGIASIDKLAQDASKGIGIPFSRVGRKCVYRWGDVLDYFEQNRATPTHKNTQN